MIQRHIAFDSKSEGKKTTNAVKGKRNGGEKLTSEGKACLAEGLFMENQ